MKNETIKIPHKDTHIMIHLNGEYDKEELVPISHLCLRKSKKMENNKLIDRYDCFNGLTKNWLEIDEEQYLVIATTLCLQEV